MILRSRDRVYNTYSIEYSFNPERFDDNFYDVTFEVESNNCQKFYDNNNRVVEIFIVRMKHRRKDSNPSGCIFLNGYLIYNGILFNNIVDRLYDNGVFI